jgi:hypothetical protein
MGGFGTTVLGGITTIVFVYLFLHYANNVKTESGGAVKAYADIAKTFRGSGI